MQKEHKKSLLTFKWFLLWTLIYSILYLISSIFLPRLFGSQHFFQVWFIYFLIFGIFFSISARIIHSLIHNNTIYIGSDVFFFWTFAYGFALWLSEFLKDYFITDLAFSFLTNKFLEALFVGLVVYATIKLIKKMEFGKGGIRSSFRRAPSQIFTGVVLFVLGVLCWRFSTIVFIDWLNWVEGVSWSFLIGLGLMIAGFLVLLAWWRNNVLQHRIGLKFGRW